VDAESFVAQTQEFQAVNPLDPQSNIPPPSHIVEEQQVRLLDDPVTQRLQADSIKHEQLIETCVLQMEAMKLENQRRDEAHAAEVGTLRAQLEAQRNEAEAQAAKQAELMTEKERKFARVCEILTNRQEKHKAEALERDLATMDVLTGVKDILNDKIEVVSIQHQFATMPPREELKRMKMNDRPAYRQLIKITHEMGRTDPVAYWKWVLSIRLQKPDLDEIDTCLHVDAVLKGLSLALRKDWQDDVWAAMEELLMKRASEFGRFSAEEADHLRFWGKVREQLDRLELIHDDW
jgi:hypothetical protein